MNLQFVLIGLNLLSINKTFPYEYFYDNKSELMSFIESAYNLSDKKVKLTLHAINIFKREIAVLLENNRKVAKMCIW